MSNLDQKISALSAKYLPLAEEILKEAIRIPADYVDKPVDQGGDPECGLSNHEGPRLKYLKKRIVEIDAVRSPEDVWFDEYGNLVWTVKDLNDGIPDSEKRIIYFDGQTFLGSPAFVQTCLRIKKLYEAQISDVFSSYSRRIQKRL